MSTVAGATMGHMGATTRLKGFGVIPIGSTMGRTPRCDAVSGVTTGQNHIHISLEQSNIQLIVTCIVIKSSLNRKH